MAQKTYLIENLGCANCAAKMEGKMNTLPGVQASITFATRQLRITADDPDGLLPQLQKIVGSIESDARIAAPKPAEKAPYDHGESIVPLLIGAGLFVLGLVLDWIGIQLFGIGVSLACYIGAYLVLGREVLLTAGKNLIKGHVVDENFLMSIATLGAFAIGEFPEAVGVMLFYRVGEYFEHRAVARSRSQIMEAVDLRPEVVTLAFGGTIPAEEAEPGDFLLVRPGDRIPLDGTVVAGESFIDTAPITGEPVPVAVRPGDSVISGCVNTSGQLTVRVEKALSESMVTRILNAVENAAAGKPKIDRFITRFARIYTPVVVAAAALTAVVPSLITGDWSYWVYTALSFLVMSCPCALVLSVPLAFFSGIGAGSKRNILFKGGAAIEAMGKLKAVVLDKTGTLTKGEFRLQKINACGDFSEDELLMRCASCEQASSHPIAHSITAAAKEKNISLKTPQRLQETAGRGVEAVLEGQTILCGSRSLMVESGVSFPESPSGHASLVYVAIDGKPAGILEIADTIKPGAAAAVSRLKSMGLKTVMLTGDGDDAAKAVAAELGIDRIHARLLPQDKLEILQNVRSELGAVMFVGDGINDAPVLAGADVGAAMGSGADAAIEAADAVLMTGAVQSIPDSISIARNTGRIAMQNVVFALAVKLIVMLLGLCGWANMWLAVFADTGVAMLCVLNSIRALYKR